MQLVAPVLLSILGGFGSTAFAGDEASRDTPVDLSTNVLALTGGIATVAVDVAASRRVSIEGLVGVGRESAELDADRTWSWVWQPNNLLGKFYL
ncbi:MAG: hypothetical protein AAF211_17075, partial [Myxococcota bacterium]